MGNQLFQLNFAHHLALSLVDHKIHIIDGSIGNDRDYALQDVMRTCTHLNSSFLSSNLGKSFIRVLYGLRRRYPKLLLKTYRTLSPKQAYGDGSDLIEQIRDISSNYIFIRGDFISNRIPMSQCPIVGLRDSERLKSPNRTLDHEVVVHIRRGDYLVHKNYGPLSLAYFKNVLDEFPASYRILIHTDDEVFVQENLKLNQEFTLKGKAYSPLELIWDCGHAEHFIGSNSTLSWWAAKYLKLVTTRETIHVIMPRRWLRNEIDPNYDLLDSDWTLVDPFWDR